jgi:ankyrin repeat protein
MREHPDLEQLKRQAKRLLNAFRAGDPAATAEVNAHYDGAQAATFALHYAQLVVARSYGFDSWPKLKAYVDGVTIRRLVEAVRAGDIERVRTMLKARPELADLTVSYGDEHRAIHYAVMHRQPEIARLLMQKGADARAGIDPHRDATSAWTLARERGYEEMVAIIEEEEERRSRRTARGASAAAAPATEAGDEAERTAVATGDLQWLRARWAEGKLTNRVRWEDGGLLTVAVRNDRMEALAFLLDCGFDPDERVSSGEGDWIAYSQGFPLWHAAALGRREMAKLLLDRGANPNVHVDSSGSAVYSAYSHKQWPMVELLRERGGIVTGDIAAIYRQTDVARQLLSSGQALAEEVLRFGADSGAVEVVRLALERIDWARDDPRWLGMLASPLSFWHHIPWLYAGNKEFDREGYLECFRLILSRCDVHVTGGFGRTILHEIAAMGDWISDSEVATFGRAALEAGSRLDRRDEILCSTPLGWACRWGRLGLVRVLLEYGADREEEDAEAWARPREWARKMGHGEIVEALG